ncbi:ATP:cob(I)alamin adenosyltransferase [Vibrio europaeus]|uniref:ATP:cob(I)alamin adenosyltransferase n=1 Tax=Vibrio europaeus TaxID=300876 RepID=UPI00148DFD4F|nr:ATP:cob(I)alamin adenosyltransferase [Vibrio europaeus]MDC5820565.1 ATP:cob(I)alamin adenosyltransferase [Vibrio europaeus]MDC5855360.1 ATP:cob(I)alamin adenosyltransferase [Vibrio europaeus]MDC5870697.1 ATP:cob(I)alamin adenosyltransferase [Vibrio europaeus]NOH22205.1 ATP:cob(I)alamin adenosyltransferase [Vibrio europaeus]
MRPVSKEHGEICYPFIYEDSPVCDFEIAADELCSRIGLVLTMELDTLCRDILSRVQPNVYHLNGSVRGKLAIDEQQVQELYQDYNLLRDKLDGGFRGFVLPGGHPISAELHLCRTQAKKTVRALVAVEHSGKKSPAPILFRYANLLANVMYTLASYTNLLHEVNEVEFVSRSY